MKKKYSEKKSRRMSGAQQVECDPLVPQRVENAIRKRIQEISLIDCEDEVSAFANCVRNRY